jgi:hypothetical protein
MAGENEVSAAPAKYQGKGQKAEGKRGRQKAGRAEADK